jgi:hypothetical protein
MDKTTEYRKNKKHNKSKIKAGQMSKISSQDCENILNQLPSGDFDRKTEVTEKKELKKEEVKDDLLNTSVKPSSGTMEDADEDDEYEKFDPDYFEPKVYK